MSDSKLELLEKKINYLMDRQEIMDVICRNGQGCDRQDVDILAACYAEHGVDEHGSANVIDGKKFPEWANMVHNYGSTQSLHNITTHTCDIDGNIAHAESYVMGAFFNTDGQTSRILCGRYLDKLEKIDGKWQIVLRRCTVEVGINADSSFMNSDYFKNMGFLKGLRNKDDIFYQRPLNLDETPEGHRWE